VEATLLREFDAAANEEGLSRNKALEEAMRVFVSSRRRRLLRSDFSK
jgi:metal-responsive CopG/Arc/MetJ family transcriptional regulator